MARHAGASCVEVSLSRSACRLIVEVRDNGRGFDPWGATNKKSFGLIGMRERAAVLGGNIDIASGAGQRGTVVSVCLPINETAGLYDSAIQTGRSSYP